MIDKRTSSILFTILIFTAGLVLLYAARRPLLLLVFSVLFAYLLEPIVEWFQRRFRDSRTMGIVATYFVLISAVSIFLAAAGPKIVQESSKLAHKLPAVTETIGSGDIAQEVGARRGWTYDTQYRLREFLTAHRTEFDGYVQRVIKKVPAMAGDLLWLMLIPIFAVFILKCKTAFAKTVLVLVDNAHDRHFLRGILTDLDVMLAAFIRAQLTLAAVAVMAYTVILFVFGFPYSFLVASVAGVLEFIPVLGPLAGNAAIMATAISTGYSHWLGILIFLIIWRGIQDYVTSPLLMGRGVKLHPFTVILGVLICGDVAGLPGVFLSVPLMASLRIVWKNWEQRAVAIKAANSEDIEAESLAN